MKPSLMNGRVRIKRSDKEGRGCRGLAPEVRTELGRVNFDLSVHLGHPYLSRLQKEDRNGHGHEHGRRIVRRRHAGAHSNRLLH